MPNNEIMLLNFYGDKVRKGGNKLFGRGRGFIIIIIWAGITSWGLHSPVGVAVRGRGQDVGSGDRQNNNTPGHQTASLIRNLTEPTQRCPVPAVEKPLPRGIRWHPCGELAWQLDPDVGAKWRR